MSEQEKGGAAAFIASVNVQSTADEKAQNDHVDLSQAHAINMLEGFVEWSKAKPVMKTFPGDLDGNALGDVAGATIVALATLSARSKPDPRSAMACTQQMAGLFFNAYMASVMKAQG